MTAPPAHRRLTPLAALVGALLCVAAFWAAGEASGRYVILYGRHGWGPPETAFLLNFLLLGLPCAGLLTVALGRWFGDRLAADFEGLAHTTIGRARLAAAVVAPSIGILVTLARYGVLRNTAVTDDENVYDFMARVWSTGRLYAVSLSPDLRPFFDNQFIVNDGRWYGIYAPGHPLVLTVGQWLGAIRWVTTVEAMLTVLLAWALADRLFGRRAGLLTLAFLAVSPFFLLVSATMLAHPTAALALTAFAYASARVLESPGAVRWWFVAGGALGFAGLTRPLAAVAFGLPWLVVLGRAATRGGRAARGAVCASAMALAAAMLFAGYNAAVTGHPLRTGYQVFSEAHDFTFTLGSLRAPAPVASIYELYYSLARLDFWLLGWPISLLLVPFARPMSASRALQLGSLATVLAYALLRVPSINVVGPVHYGELVPALLILSASGLEELVARAGRLLGREGLRAALAAPVALTAVAGLFFWPVYAPSLRTMSDVARAPYDLVERAGLRNAVVFVGSLPALQSIPGAWVYRHRNNSPDLSDPVLFVNDLGAENARLLARLSGRKAYRLTMDGNRLALTPLP
jgi:hypothetical protein